MHALFRQRPWFTGSLRLPNAPRGMLGDHEAMFFYYLAKDYFHGKGTIIDAGSFLGKSAYFFAEGLRANPSRVATRDRIHCFDNFLVNEEMTIEFIRRELGKSVGIGDSTRAIFEQQVGPVRELLEVHAGDFHCVAWPPQPIEILMIDIAKSESLGKRVVELFFPHLIPGVSVVVHQDYHHPWLPHIHVVMEYLSDYFDLVAPRIDDSAGFICAQTIPGDMLSRAIRYDFTIDEQLQLMDRALDRLPVADRCYVELARLVLRAKKVDARQLRAEYDEIAGRRKTEAQQDRFYSAYLEAVGNYVDELEGWRQRDLGNFAQALQLADRLVARGRHDTHILVMRGTALMGLGRLVEAENALREALQPIRRNGYAYTELGIVLALQGRINEAEAVVVEGIFDRTAVAATPRHFFNFLGDLWQTHLRPGQVEAIMQRLRAELGNEPEVWVLDARVSLFNGDREAAVRSLRKAQELGLSMERCAEVRQKTGVTPEEWSSVKQG